MLPFDPAKEFFYIAGPKEDIHAFCKAFHTDPTAFYAREDKCYHNGEIDLQLGFFQKGNFACASCSTYTPAFLLAVNKVVEQFPRCEVIRHRGYDRVCDANIFDYKQIDHDQLRLYEGYNPKCIGNWYAVVGQPDCFAGWINLFLFGHISYTHITIRLKNGKELTYTGNNVLLSKEIALFKKTPLDVELLSELCCMTAPERNKNKVKQEVLKAVKTPDVLQLIAFTTFHRRKKLKMEERAQLTDPSVQAFSHTWVEEMEEDTLDYATALSTQKRRVQLQAVESTEQGEYQENLYTLKDKTTKKKLIL